MDVQNFSFISKILGIIKWNVMKMHRIYKKHSSVEFDNLSRDFHSIINLAGMCCFKWFGICNYAYINLVLLLIKLFLRSFLIWKMIEILNPHMSYVNSQHYAFDDDGSRTSKVDRERPITSKHLEYWKNCLSTDLKFNIHFISNFTPCSLY